MLTIAVLGQKAANWAGINLNPTCPTRSLGWVEFMLWEGRSGLHSKISTRPHNHVGFVSSTNQTQYQHNPTIYILAYITNIFYIVYNILASHRSYLLQVISMSQRGFLYVFGINLNQYTSQFSYATGLNLTNLTQPQFSLRNGAVALEKFQPEVR